MQFDDILEALAIKLIQIIPIKIKLFEIHKCKLLRTFHQQPFKVEFFCDGHQQKKTVIFEVVLDVLIHFLQYCADFEILDSFE